MFPSRFTPLPLELVFYGLAGLLILQSIRWLYIYFTHLSTIAHLPGPLRTDWFFGNLPDLNFGEVGVAHIDWQKRYGCAFKIHGLAGVCNLRH